MPFAHLNVNVGRSLKLVTSITCRVLQDADNNADMFCSCVSLIKASSEGLEDARFRVCEDEREEIIAYVSTLFGQTKQ